MRYSNEINKFSFALVRIIVIVGVLFPEVIPEMISVMLLLHDIFSILYFLLVFS
jgi:hypothetical protein